MTERYWISSTDLAAALGRPLSWERLLAPLSTGELIAKAGTLLIYDIGANGDWRQNESPRSDEVITCDFWRSLGPADLTDSSDFLRASVPFVTLRQSSPIDFIGRGDRVGVVISEVFFESVSARDYFKLADEESAPEVILSELPDGYRSDLLDRVGSDRLWTWPEAVAWVETRSIDVVAARRAVGAAARSANIESVAAAQMHVCSAGQRSDGAGILAEAIFAGSVKSEGRERLRDASTLIDPSRWRGGVIKVGVTADLCRAGNLAVVWAYDVAVDRAELVARFPHDPNYSPHPSAVRQPKFPSVGRRANSNAYDDTDVLAVMRTLIEDGNAGNASDAAKQVDAMGIVEGAPTADGRWRRVQRKYSAAEGTNKLPPAAPKGTGLWLSVARH